MNMCQTLRIMSWREMLNEKKTQTGVNAKSASFYLRGNYLLAWVEIMEENIMC